MITSQNYMITNNQKMPLLYAQLSIDLIDKIWFRSKGWHDAIIMSMFKWYGIFWPYPLGPTLVWAFKTMDSRMYFRGTFRFFYKSFLMSGCSFDFLSFWAPSKQSPQSWPIPWPTSWPLWRLLGHPAYFGLNSSPSGGHTRANLGHASSKI